jgi:hypothetical protein
MEIPMRALSFFAAAAISLTVVGAAAAQSSRQSLYIDAKPRSWLDAGKVVEPHSMQNYMYDMHGVSAGAGYSNQGLLPGRFSGGAPIKIDIPAPDFLRR